MNVWRNAYTSHETNLNFQKRLISNTAYTDTSWAIFIHTYTQKITIIWYLWSLFQINTRVLVSISNKHFEFSCKLSNTRTNLIKNTIETQINNTIEMILWRTWTPTSFVSAWRRSDLHHNVGLNSHGIKIYIYTTIKSFPIKF